MGLLTGCGSGGQRSVEPRDFASHAGQASATAAGTIPSHEPVGAPSARTPPATTPPAEPGRPGDGLAASLQNNPADEAAVRQFKETLSTPQITPTMTVAQARALAVDGMVGQVNGQAIYASRVLSPLHEQFTRLGQTLAPAVFRQEAAKPILATLEEIVFNHLILGEAERDLSDQERMGLSFMMRQEREKLIRKWGAGSRIVADDMLRQREGKGLDEKLQEFRQQMLIQRYMQQKLFPRINITRKDIERYYNDNLKQFQPEPTRMVRLIRAETPAAAQAIEAELQQGQTFEEVAKSRFNGYRREQGGLFAEKITGDEIFGIVPLNQAVLELKAGEHSPRIDVGQTAYWVQVASLETGTPRSLREAQSEIEELLRRQRFQQLLARYRNTIFARGAYNPIPQMAESLLEIAVNRYARPTG